MTITTELALPSPPCLGKQGLLADTQPSLLCLLPGTYQLTGALSPGTGSFPCPPRDNKCRCSPTPSRLTTCVVPGLEINEADPGGVREQKCLGPVSYFYSATHLIILRCINPSFHCSSGKSLCSWEGENLGVLVELNRGPLHCKSRQRWALIH